MFCRYCGKEIPEDSNFCSYCQKQLNVDIQNDTLKKIDTPAEAVQPEKLNVKPFVRAEHMRANHKKERAPVPKDQSTTMGVVSWVLSTYSILTIFMLLLGLLGYVTSPDIPNTTYTFRNSSRSMIGSVRFLVGNLAAPVGAPVWITAIIPFTFVAMALTFAIIQFVRSKKTFSKVTLITVSALTLVMLVLHIFLYEAIAAAII